jgi:hypothetical protein
MKARIMPKKPKKPNDNSQESTLGPFAKALGDIYINESEAEPEAPGSGGDGESAPEGGGEKSEAPSEGETCE